MPAKTPYDYERALKAALLEVKVQTCINALNKGQRKFEPSAIDPLRMIIKQQYDLKSDTLELFHTSHLSDKLFLETVKDDHPYVFVQDDLPAEKVQGTSLTNEQMAGMSASELFAHSNKESGS